MMDEFESLSRTKWDCKYHVVFIPKCWRKTLYMSIGSQPEPRIGFQKGPQTSILLFVPQRSPILPSRPMHRMSRRAERLSRTAAVSAAARRACS